MANVNFSSRLMIKSQRLLIRILVVSLVIAAIAIVGYVYLVSNARLPMGEDTRKACDFDHDDDCDGADKQIFSSYAGKCEPDAGYNPQADDDGSGCVDDVDFRYLFETE